MAELTQFLLDGKGQLEGQIKINSRRELLDPDILPYPAKNGTFLQPEGVALLSARFVHKILKSSWKRL